MEDDQDGAIRMWKGKANLEASFHAKCLQEAISAGCIIAGCISVASAAGATGLLKRKEGSDG